MTKEEILAMEAEMEVYAQLSDKRQREIEIATFESEKWGPDGVVDFFEYPKFFWWRAERGLEQRPEPIDTHCPRCFSTDVNISYPYISCRCCGYFEDLIDYPISRR